MTVVDLAAFLRDILAGKMNYTLTGPARVSEIRQVKDIAYFDVTIGDTV